MARSFYELLGVDSSATDAQLKKAINKIVESLSEFLSVSIKAVAQKSDAAGQKNIQDVIARMGVILQKMEPMLEQELNEQAQEEFSALVGECLMLVMPLVTLADQSPEISDGFSALGQTAKRALYDSFVSMVADLEKELA